MYISGIFRTGVWMAKYRASKNGVEGNSKGSGSLLGGKYDMNYSRPVAQHRFVKKP